MSEIITDEQADELIDIGQGLLMTMSTRAEDFCARHGYADPRLSNTVMLTLAEILLEGLLISRFEDIGRIALMRKVSHNVQQVLHERRRKARHQA